MSNPDVIAISSSISNLDMAYEYEDLLLDQGYQTMWTIDPSALEEVHRDSEGNLNVGDLLEMLGDPQILKGRLDAIKVADAVLGINEEKWGSQICHVPSVTEYDLVLAAAHGTLPVLSQSFPRKARTGAMGDIYRAKNMQALGVRELWGNVGRLVLLLRDHREAPGLPDAREYVQLLQLEQGEQ